MLYCDLDVNGARAWTAAPVMLGVSVGTAPYQGLRGTLVAVAPAGVSEDPAWEGLGTSFFLIFIPAGGPPNKQVPLRATPSQQLSIVLDGQDCVLSVYEKPLP